MATINKERLKTLMKKLDYAEFLVDTSDNVEDVKKAVDLVQNVFHTLQFGYDNDEIENDDELLDIDQTELGEFDKWD